MKSFLKKYFIPHQENNFKPHILQRAAVLTMLFLVLMSFAITNIQALLLVSSNTFLSSILPAVIVDITNETRESEDLNILTRNATLDFAAQAKAEHMAEYEYFAHNSPDGITPWHWFDQVGYSYSSAGENLAVHFTDSQELVDAWMESPGHRENILDDQYTEIGIGTAKGEYKGFPTIFVVQMFGRPATVIATPDPTPSVASAVEVPVEVIEEPVVLAENTIDPEPEVIEATEDILIEEDISDIEPKEPVLLSELATTTGLAPANIKNPDNNIRGGGESTVVEQIATQPITLLNLIYILLATFVVAILIVSIAIEWRKQHPVQIAYGTGLLAAMTLMLFVQKTLLQGALII